ncbi:hypothetical protein R84B8_01924 [Treponema sp. R8-4-B8]
MKLKALLIITVLAVFTQETVFAKGIKEERAVNEYNALYERVIAYLGEGNFASSIPLLERMNQLRPQELENIEALGIFYMLLPEERPEFAKAYYWLNEAERRGSSSNMVYFYLACVYSLDGDVLNSVTEMNKAVALGYINIEWMSLYDDLENFRTSSWWERISDNYMQIGRILSLFNEIYSDQSEIGIFDKATLCDNIIIDLENNAPHIPALRNIPLYYLASLYKRIGNYDKAVQCLLEVKSIMAQTIGKTHPSYIQLLKDMSTLYLEIQDYDEAVECYMEILDLM